MRHRAINAEFVSVIFKFVSAASQPDTTGYVSSENLFKPSKTKDTYGTNSS